MNEYNLCPKCGGAKSLNQPEHSTLVRTSVFRACSCTPDSVVKCDYCNATEKVTTFSDRAGQKPDIHICADCYSCGVESKLSGRLAKEPKG